MGLGRCKGAKCGARVLWALTVDDKPIPLDPTPDPNGNVVVVETYPSGVHKVRVLGQNTALFGDGLDGDRYMPHHATCPDREEFRA